MNRTTDFRALVQRTKNGNMTRIKAFVTSYNKDPLLAFQTSFPVQKALIENPILEVIEGICQEHIDSVATPDENYVFELIREHLTHLLLKDTRSTYEGPVGTCQQSIAHEVLCYWLQQAYLFQKQQYR